MKTPRQIIKKSWRSEWIQCYSPLLFLCIILLMSSYGVKAQQTCNDAFLNSGKLHFSVPNESSNSDWHSQEKINGMNMIDIDINWGPYETSEGVYDMNYINGVKLKIDQFVNDGWKISLRINWQYVPGWAKEKPDSRFINQYGDAFAEVGDPGRDVVDLVFNSSLRLNQSNTLDGIFADLGAAYLNKISVITFGGGWYGEVTYPDYEYKGLKNCYWAYGPNALASFRNAMQTKFGTISNLNTSWGASYRSFSDVKFLPGDASPNNNKARDFINWYLDAQKNYLLFQKDKLRAHYSGYIAVLCGSWGVRDGKLDAAIAGNLDEASGNSEITRGFDFKRYITAFKNGGVTKFFVQCTWVDSNPEWSSSTNPDPSTWLASIAHSNGFLATGEFTANSTRLSLSAERMINNHLLYLTYVPEVKFFDGTNSPSISDWGTMTTWANNEFKSKAPTAFNIQKVSGSLGGDIAFNYSVKDYQGDPISLCIEYRTSPNGFWQSAAVTGVVQNLASSQSGVQHSITWNSGVNGASGNYYEFRISPTDKKWPGIAGVYKYSFDGN